MKSKITQAIDQVVSSAIHPALKADGFKKRGRTFHKAVDDLYQVVQIQGSRYNDFDTGKFSINLGVACPDIVPLWLGNDPGESPGRYMLLYERIGNLLPTQQDTWWQIQPGTDLVAIASNVHDTLMKYGLRFFELPALQSTHALLEALDNHTLPLRVFGAPAIRDKLHAVLLHKAGRDDEAKAVLHNLIAGKEHLPGLNGFIRQIKALGTRLGYATIEGQ